MPDGSRTFDSGEADPRSISAVYRAHSMYVWRVLRHMGVPDEDLDDAVQETFLVVLRRLPEFEERASLKTWIYAIATRVASTRRRSRQREARRRDRAGAQMHGSSTMDPELALEKAQAAQLVERLLGQLDETKRTVFVLAEIEGIKVPEISRILGVNPRTVHSRLRAARERFGLALRRLQAKEDGDLRMARLRPRALLRDAASERPPPARRKAVAFALMRDLERGDVPQLMGGEPLAQGASSAGWSWSLAVAGAAIVSWVTLTGGPSTDPLPSATHQHGKTPAVVPPKVVVPSTAPPESAVSSPTPAASSPESESAVPAKAAARANPIPRSPGPSRATGSSSPAKPPAVPSVESELAEETRLLQRARAALRDGDPRAALEWADEHLKRFPRGMLADDARSTRLRSLCADGRNAEALAFASRLSGGATISRWHEIVTAGCSG